MAFTLATNTTGADYDIRITNTDALAESIRKVFSVRNVSGGLQNALRVYEACTQAAFEAAAASIAVAVTGASTSVGTAGMFPKIGDQLVIGFVRPHPVVAGKLVTRPFVIPAPHPDIYSTSTLKPVMIRGETLADGLAADRPTALGSLVDWLEDALLYEHDGTIHVGEWTYSEARSALISLPREYDGSDLT